MQVLSKSCWFLAATEKALEMGHPILTNIIMIGAAAGAGVLPLKRSDFEAVIRKTLTGDKQELNLKAFDLGSDMIAANAERSNNFKKDCP